MRDCECGLVHALLEGVDDMLMESIGNRIQKYEGKQICARVGGLLYLYLCMNVPMCKGTSALSNILQFMNV